MSKKAWYFFMGGDPLNHECYHRVTGHSCFCGDKICTIYVYDNGITPQGPLSVNLQTYIHNALATQRLQPEIPYDTKKYVYLKDS